MCLCAAMLKRKIIFILFLIIGILVIILLTNIQTHPNKTFIIDQYEKDTLTNEENKSFIKYRTECKNNFAKFKFGKKDKYLVLYNYVISKNRYHCEDSITYVTNGDYSYLTNLITTVKRWQGPISVALHAPGSDFNVTLESIVYMRNCIPEIEQFVTFHLYFNKKFSPQQMPLPNTILSMKSNCSTKPPYENVSKKDKFVSKNKMLYPINIGRNIARSMAETHFVLVCDIELYPSLNIIPQFLTLIAGPEDVINGLGPIVFVLPVFEIERGANLPNNKFELKQLISRGAAVSFHNNTCSRCHAIPNYDGWIKDNNYQNLGVFTMAKKKGIYNVWEPFYIGTKGEPPFDERLFWEGRSDKIVQAYTMCLLDYTFSVLNNAFLIHTPGIKQNDGGGKNAAVQNTDRLIEQTIIPELYKLYGNKPNCSYY